MEIKRKILLRFQSTLPTRGSDCVGIAVEQFRQRFQSTLPTRGSDVIKAAIKVFH